MDVFDKKYRNMRFRPESAAVTKIDLYFYEEFMTSGTGFVYRFGTDLFLVTNWHVLSGTHPITRLTRDPRGYTPNRAKFHVTVYSADEGSMFFKPIEMQLRDGEEKFWFEHAGYENHNDELMIVDVAAIPLENSCDDFTEVSDRIAAFPAQIVISGEFKNDGSEDEIPDDGVGHAYPKVSSQVFILGYPKGIPTQGVIPVWKSGFIATEPLVRALDGAPIILIDALTRDGMSGSPVISFGSELITANGKVMSDGRSDQSPWLVGVYAGREGVTANEVDMALGRAWRKECIDQLIMDNLQRQNLRDEDE